MEYRQFGRSGLKVPVLSLGTATFGGTDAFFQNWGSTGVAEASRLIDLCLDAGVNFLDTADLYSSGDSEKILGEAIKGRRDRLLISTKATFRAGEGPNDIGSSRYHLIRACEASLKRLKTDHIDVYFMHGFDALTPIEETLRALDDLTRAGNGGIRAAALRGANGAAAIIPPWGARGSATERVRFRKDFVNQEPLLKLKFYGTRPAPGSCSTSSAAALPAGLQHRECVS